MPRLTDVSVVRARLERDRPWAAFSLADLDPPQAAHARWFGYEQGDAVVLLYGAYDPPIVIAHGDIDACDALLGEPEVAEASHRVYLNIVPALRARIRRHFAAFDDRRMVRFLLPQTEVHLAATHPGVVALGPQDLAALQALYAEEPPAFFLPSQLRDGVYFGVREGAELVAVAGTHVVSDVAQVGALGNVYTRRDRRQRGLADAVTRAVTRALVARGIRTIVLNIVGTNEAARRVYERIGFREHGVYYEGSAAR
jgi:ribosomal protein S18 acetylase RimI-like enzyme